MTTKPAYLLLLFTGFFYRLFYSCADRLAKDGMPFSYHVHHYRHVFSFPLMLYTGLYLHGNGCHMSHSKVPTGRHSLPHYLKPLEYTVALAGKNTHRPERIFSF